MSREESLAAQLRHLVDRFNDLARELATEHSVRVDFDVLERAYIGPGGRYPCLTVSILKEV